MPGFALVFSPEDVGSMFHQKRLYPPMRLYGVKTQKTTSEHVYLFAVSSLFDSSMQIWKIHVETALG